MKNKLVFIAIIFLVVFSSRGDKVMAEYNIQMSQRNSSNTGWDKHYPMTKYENVITDSSINLMHPPAPLVAPVGNGIADDTVAIQNILNFAGLNGKSVEIPDKTFFVTSLTSGGCKYIYGHGENSVIVSSTDSTVLTLNSDDTVVENIKFVGNISKSNQKGILIDGYFNCTVHKCIFKDIGGKAVHAINIGTSQHGHKDGATISNNKFINCYRGIDCGANGEYVNILSNVFQDQCGWAIWTTAGNTLIVGNNIVKCKNGIYQGSSGNGGHSVITGNNINHTFTDNGNSTYTTGYALWFDGVQTSEIVSENAIFDGNIFIGNSQGIDINNNILAVVNYNFENAYGCSIHDNRFYKAYGHNIVNNYNGKASFVDWYNNKTIDGAYGPSIENIKGGQVSGTITGGQTLAGSGLDAIVNITAQSNTANVTNNSRIAFWNAATNKAKNFGFGGNRITINAQVYVTFASGDTSLTMMTLYVGSKPYIMNATRFGTNAVYFTFNGIVIAEPNDEIYLSLLNSSGGIATITSTNGRFLVEGL